MAAPFTEQNYLDIVDILLLDPDYLENGSELRDRGQALEDQDERLGTDLVGKVQQAIADYLAARTAYQTAIESDDALGVSSQSVSGEYSVSWAKGSAANAKYSNYLIAMRRHYQIIVQYMRWEKTNPYTATVVRTIS